MIVRFQYNFLEMDATDSVTNSSSSSTKWMGSIALAIAIGVPALLFVGPYIWWPLFYLWFLSPFIVGGAELLALGLAWAAKNTLVGKIGMGVSGFLLLLCVGVWGYFAFGYLFK
ncbi:hypothetical protein IAD21_03843 [Abditibacteriota bacterium]|nr:hypothetical protein IAD21_03843 [Abditibacteriota bacterium]